MSNPAGAAPAIPAPPLESRSRFAEGILILLATLFIVSPSAGAWLGAFDSYNFHRYLQFTTCVVLLSFVAAPPARQAVARALRCTPSAVPYLMTSIVCIGVTSSLFAARPAYGIREVALFAVLTVIAAVLATVVWSLGPLANRILAYATAGSALTYLLLFLWTATTGRAGSTTYLQGIPPDFGFANPRFFGDVKSWTLPLLAAPLLFRRPTSQLLHAALWVALWAWWMFTIAVGSRAVIAAMVAAAVGILIVFGRSAVPWLRTQIAGLAGGTLLFLLCSPVMWTGMSSLGSRLVEDGASGRGRGELWSTAIGLTADNPLLGIGPGMYAHVGASYAHPHNAILQIAAEWGVPVLVAVLVLVSWGARNWIRARRREVAASDDTRDRAIPIALTASLIAGGVTAMFSGMIVMPLSQTFGAIIIGWAWGYHLWQSDGERLVASRTVTSRRLWVLPTVGVIALTVLASMVNLPTHEIEPGERFAPRFWVNGRIP